MTLTSTCINLASFLRVAGTGTTSLIYSVEVLYDCVLGPDEILSFGRFLSRLFSDSYSERDVGLLMICLV